MLSDFEIDAVIRPFVERQEKLNTWTINKIAQRVKEIGELSKSDLRKLITLYKTGADARLINQEIANVCQIQEQNVKEMVRKVASKTYLDAKPFYDYRHKSQIPYERNTCLQRTVNAIAKQTQDTFKNLSNSKATGFMIRDLKNPTAIKFQSVTQTYQSVIDEAAQAVQSGVMDFDTAMRRTLKQLNESGLRRAYWDSGYSRRLDSTVRMNILGAVRQINQQVQQQIAEEIKADGIELSAHSFSAPDHEPIQGRIFTMENFDKMQSELSFEDTTGAKFPAMRRPIGEWNCKHFTQAIIIAKHKPTWSIEELEELKQQNAKGYTTSDGKHYSMYECTQIQRRYETEIRYAKEGYMMAKTADNDSLAEQYKAKLSKLNNEYNQFCKDTHLRKERNRTFVQDFYKY